MKNIVIAITGPTASGKTQLAIKLAQQINAEIISNMVTNTLLNMNCQT